MYYKFLVPDFILAADGDGDQLDLMVQVRMSELEVDDSDGSGLSHSVPRDRGHRELLALRLVGSAVVGLEANILKAKQDNFSQRRS